MTIIVARPAGPEREHHARGVGELDCGLREHTGERRREQRALAAGMTRRDPAWEFSATGTRWRLYHSGAAAESVAGALAQAVEHDEARWSRFRPDSELCALNRGAGQWQTVSVETFALLEACERWTHARKAYSSHWSGAPSKPGGTATASVRGLRSLRAAPPERPSPHVSRSMLRA